MNEELKQQAHKEFDDLFLTKSKCCNADVRKLLARKNNDLYCKTCGRFCKEIEKTKADDIKSFLDSLIDKTVQKTEERIVGMMAEFLKDELGYKGKYIEQDLSKKNHGTCCYCSECGHFNDECVCKNNRIHKFMQSLITNKSDINKLTD